MCSPWNPTGGEMVGAHRARGVGSTPTPALIPASSAGPPPVYHIAAKLVKAGTLNIVLRKNQPPTFNPHSAWPPAPILPVCSELAATLDSPHGACYHTSIVCCS